MKVLHVYRTYFPDTQGGLEEAIRQISFGTSRLGVDNRVLTLQSKPGEAQLSLPEADVYRAPRQWVLKSCDVGFGMIPLFREMQEWCDLVHFHFPWPFADLVEMVAGRKPYIVTYHSDIVRQKLLRIAYWPLNRYFLNKAQRLVATSPPYAESSALLKRYRDKVEVIPLSLDERSYPLVDEQVLDDVRRRFGESFFFFIGVFRYYKGLKYLLQAMQGAPFKLVLAGKGPEEVALREQAKALGLDNVVFAGPVTDAEKVALFHLCKAVVFPSCQRSEAFGVTLLEAAMLSKPMISTELGTGTSYINQHEETGLVVEPRSADAIRTAMETLENDPARTHQMGEKARQHFQALFTNDIAGQRYHALYDQVLQERLQEAGGAG